MRVHKPKTEDVIFVSSRLMSFSSFACYGMSGFFKAPLVLSGLYWGRGGDNMKKFICEILHWC